MGSESIEDHKKIVAQIIEHHFGDSPTQVVRMKTGRANEVYSVAIPGQEVIVRMNANGRAMANTENHIRLFKSQGIPVPEILASDYTKNFIPCAYQIQTKLLGRDIGEVIGALSEEQLKAIAREIAAISNKLVSFPTNGKFGWSGGDVNPAYVSWLDLLIKMQSDVIDRTNQTGVVQRRYIDAMQTLIEQNKAFFSEVPSVFYYDDMNSKNVLIHDGKFSGIVDLDTIEYGDPLEGVGRIEASWYGTIYGSTYTNAVIDELGLNEEQKHIVSVYAALNRIWWLSEQGIKFNENTSTMIDQEGIKRDEEIIDEMLKNLGVPEPEKK